MGEVELEEKTQMAEWEETRKILLSKNPLAEIPTPVEYPESDGEPMAETDVHREQVFYLIHSLRNYFRDDPQVYVSGNLFLYYAEGDPDQKLAPDVFVVFGVPNRERSTYKLWEEGKGPDVVFEITSRGTWQEDLGSKKALYAVLGVREYFLFDPLEEYLKPQLKGYHLEGEEYRRMPDDFTSSGERRLKSEVLGLELRLEEGRLRLYNPKTGQKLLTPAELQDRLSELEAELTRLRAEQS
ncbi:MAG: Uma2 family endonuclease [Anaerolineae bacterium]